MSKRVMRLTGALMSLVFAMVLTVAAFAQAHPVEGTYNVASTSSELGTVNFVMVIKKDGGKWTAEIKDSPVPLTVSSVTVDDTNKVTVVADAGGTPVTIVGKYADAKIAGDWSAGDVKGTWKADKKGAMAAAPAAAAAKPATSGAGTAAGIEGSYDFKIVADGQGEFAMTLIIKNDGGKLVTSVENGGDLNVTGIEVKEGDVTNMTATYQGNGPIPLNGKRTGDNMGGKWEFAGFSGTWEAKKKK
ncbi:MAG TPA: hypothetical protein PLD20_14830 [Blastocatellia bacterium]|nr:hypothetical protein [Blastocatellia bacterium]HMV85838.1 hypothetical protein [Blastocatellia bacterium]HMX24772.1 hypothetical protein [Blastocatellia bacterium]HMY75667.1 hypothetical protein [Blastocatellia bacterium]HMZ19207.1 hypothetical protein [Blastocatellia bacterium]